MLHRADHTSGYMAGKNDDSCDAKYNYFRLGEINTTVWDEFVTETQMRLFEEGGQRE